MSIEDRVGALERETARHGTQLEQLRTDVREVAGGVKTLIDREARRPEPISLKVLAGTASAVAAVAVVFWWLIENAPAITDIKARLTDLDHDKRGRVTLIERSLDQPASWATTTVRPPR